jgi:polyisoprenoid-binding protein YceI
MATHRIGPESGTLSLHTTRQGLAAQAGHDLTIEITRWSGTVTMGDDPADATIDVTAETGSLRVVSGTGGMKPLSERDKREITANAAKTLGVDRFPQAHFVSSTITGDGSSGTAEGTLTLHGTDRPLRLEITSSGENKYRATGSVIQTEFGIKPYTGLFGALKLADRVSFEVDVDLSGAASA